MDLEEYLKSVGKAWIKEMNKCFDSEAVQECKHIIEQRDIVPPYIIPVLKIAKKTRNAEITKKYAGMDLSVLDVAEDICDKYESTGPLFKLPKVIEKNDHESIIKAIQNVVNLREKDYLKHAIDYFWKNGENPNIVYVADALNFNATKRSMMYVSRILNAFDEKTLKRLDKYENKRKLAMAIEHACQFVDPDLDKIIDLFSDEVIKETIEKYDFKTARRIAENRFRYDKEICIRTAKLVKKCDNTDISLCMNILHEVPQVIPKVLDVFEKYSSISDQVYNAMVTNVFKTKEFDFDELMLESTYEKIINHDTPWEEMVRIAQKDYSMIRNEITDPIKEKLDHKELELINSVQLVVMDVHRARSTDDLKKIVRGYYHEMNRAISQGNNYQNKVENIRIYCREVRKHIYQEAHELMVMSDE